MITFRTLDLDGLWLRMDSRNIDPSVLVRRSGVEKITERLDSDHVEVIIGPRQSGKTTVLMMLIDALLQRGVTPQRVFYVNMDTIDRFEQFNNPMLLVEQINHVREKGERVYLFLDEVQRLDTPGKFLKGVYDLGQNIKVLATGSSSLELNSKIKEFLTGRKRETYIFPISFKEYIRYENKVPFHLMPEYLAESSLGQWQELEKIYGLYLNRIMEEMAIYGGYPAVLKAMGHQAKLEELNEIYRSYIKKDIVELLNLGKSELFTNLVKVLSAQTGNLINKSEICSLLGSNMSTVTKYMNILMETYVAAFLPPFVSSPRNEVRSAQKCYFMDNGIRNFTVRQFGEFSLRPDKGAVMENLIFTELAKEGALLDEELFYWRTKNGAEVDFLWRVGTGDDVVPVEIKTGSARPGLLSKSFHSFLETFSPQKALFLNRDLFHIEKIKQTDVYYIPNHWFLLLGRKLIA